MTLNAFPNTPTLAWSVMKAPNWATRMQRAVSGRELRVSDYVIPIYTFTLTYEVLRDKWDVRAGDGLGPAYWLGVSPYDELRQIWDFFNLQQGATIPFRFWDNTDNTTRNPSTTPNAIIFAIGDGITTTFQLIGTLRGPVIPNIINTVLINTTPTVAYTVDLNTGLLTFTTAPPNGSQLWVDFNYYYKVRFATDNLEAEEFMYQLWAMKQLKLTSVLY